MERWAFAKAPATAGWLRLPAPQVEDSIWLVFIPLGSEQSVAAKVLSLSWNMVVCRLFICSKSWLQADCCCCCCCCCTPEIVLIRALLNRNVVSNSWASKFKLSSWLWSKGISQSPRSAEELAECREWNRVLAEGNFVVLEIFSLNKESFSLEEDSLCDRDELLRFLLEDLEWFVEVSRELEEILSVDDVEEDEGDVKGNVVVMVQVELLTADEEDAPDEEDEVEIAEVPTLLKRNTSDLPVIRCNAKYDSKACRFKAAAAGELTGSKAACCKLVTIVPCNDRTTAAAAAKSFVVVEMVLVEEPLIVCCCCCWLWVFDLLQAFTSFVADDCWRCCWCCCWTAEAFTKTSNKAGLLMISVIVCCVCEDVAAFEEGVVLWEERFWFWRLLTSEVIFRNERISFEFVFLGKTFVEPDKIDDDAEDDDDEEDEAVAEEEDSLFVDAVDVEEVEDDDFVGAAELAGEIVIFVLYSCILLTAFKPKESMTNNNGWFCQKRVTKLKAQQDIADVGRQQRLRRRRWWWRWWK